MSRQYDSRIDGPRKPTTSPVEQPAPERMPVRKPKAVDPVVASTAAEEEKEWLVPPLQNIVLDFLGEAHPAPQTPAPIPSSSKRHGVAFFVQRLTDLTLQRLLMHVVRGEQEQAEAIIKVNPSLLLARGRVETYAKGKRNVRVLEGTAYQLALGDEDLKFHKDETCMVEMIGFYLDKYYPYVDEDHPGEKLRQCRAKFPAGWEEEELRRQQRDSKALRTILAAIGNASPEACEQVLNHENEIPENNAQAQALLTALNAFRDYLEPQGVITIGKHFNMQLLIDALRLYAQHYDTFGGRDSPKNNLFWCKVIGYIQRFLPACYAQALSRGIYHIVEGGEKLFRSLRFYFGTKVFFDDSDPNFRLGYNYAVCWGVAYRAVRGGWRGRGLLSLGGPNPAGRSLEKYVKQKQQHYDELCANPAISPSAGV